MLKKKRKGMILVLTMFLMLTVSIPVMAKKIPNVGIERSFSTDLPYRYVNVYFQTRTKQSYYGIGYIYLTSKSSKCTGINAWICNGSKSRCSNIVYCSSLNVKYALNYSSNYSAGSSVRLGMEDYDNTQVLHHKVKGYVNYN